jgi:hypothetical protein
MNELSVNIVLLTIRDSMIAREIILSGAHAASSLQGLRFTVAYGGSNDKHREWLLKIQSDVSSKGGDLTLILIADPDERLKRAIVAEKNWTIFISDDDPPSTNFLRVLAEKTKNAPQGTTLIAPKYYLGFTDSETILRTSIAITGATPRARIESLLTRQELAGVFYYGAHLTSCVTRWLDFFSQRDPIPSYADQVLSYLSVLSGEVHLADENAVLLRDESNWVGIESCTRSDTRNYSAAKMVAFHELFWVSDTINLIDFCACDVVATTSVLRSWIDVMLSRCVGLFDVRMNVLGEVAYEHDIVLLRAIVSIISWIRTPMDDASFSRNVFRISELAQGAREILTMNSKPGS